MRRQLKRVLRALAFPLYGYFEPRFSGLRSFMEEELRPQIDRRGDTIETRVTWVDDRVKEVKAQLADMDTRVATDTQTSAEFAAFFRRSTEGLRRELAGINALLAPGVDTRFGELLARVRAGDDPKAEVELAKLLLDVAPGCVDRVTGEHLGVELSALGPGTADFLNWAGGHTGPVAQGGLWFNPPVTVQLADGAVRTGDVNERIVEVPYVMAAVAALPTGASVLDVGATESTVSLSLASLGHHVTASDLRPYPLAHPNLTVLTGPLEDWDGPPKPLDAVISLSTIEHIGLGAYGDDHAAGDGDRQLVERFAGWLRPGGELVLTAPYGRWEVTELQRIYDAPHLDALLDGWRILDRAVCVQTAPDRWERADGEPPASTWDGGTRGVVLLRATPA